MKNIKQNIAIELFIVVALVLCIAVSAFAGRMYGGEATQSSAAYLDRVLCFNGWRVFDGDEYTEIPTPSYCGFRDGKLVIENNLPRALESGTVIAFESLGSSVAVIVGDEQVYSSFETKPNTAVPAWNFIELSNQHAEERIEICFLAPDSYDCSFAPKTYLGPKAEILLLVNMDRTANVQICISIITLGLLVFLFAAVTFMNKTFVREFVILGLFIIALGISQLWQLPAPSRDMKTNYILQCSSISIFGLLPASYCYYRANKAVGKAKKTYRILSGVCIAYYLIVVFIHWAAPGLIFRYSRYANYLFFEAIFAICIYCTHCFEKHFSSKYRVMLVASIVVFMICLGIDGFTHITSTSRMNVRPMIMGSFVFAIMQIVAVVFFAYDYIEQQIEMSKELSENRIKLMVSQMRPHFIRSALGAIRNVIKNDPDKAYNLLYDFTNYLSFNIDTLDSMDLVPFSTELRHIKEYLAIEQERFYPRVRVEYEIEADHFNIPPLSIQPIVENAVRHGALSRREGGTVTIITEETADSFIIRVVDTGVGFDVENVPAPRPSHGVSAKNATARIEQMVNGTVKTESIIGTGTTVTVMLPKGGNISENNIS